MAATTFYPKRLLAAAIAVVALSVVLSLATDLEHGAAVGVAAVLAYAGFELFFTFNPGMWWRDGRRRADAER